MIAGLKIGVVDNGEMIAGLTIMQLTVPIAETAASAPRRTRLTRESAKLLVFPLLFVLCIPLFQVPRSPIGSDESLYISEALNIAEGKGMVYATGDPVTHRAPLYPAFMAAGFKLTNLSVENAYWLPRLAVIANVFVVFFLARAFFGYTGGAVAAILAAASPFLRGLGTTLYLDGVETSFILLSLLVLWRATDGRGIQGHALAGVLLGLAFLVKESAVLFLPLPLVMTLLAHREANWKPSLLAWGAGFGVTTIWWWVWVYAANGSIFLAGKPESPLTMATLLVMIIGLIVLAIYVKAVREEGPDRASRAIGTIITLGWCGAFLYGLDIRAYLFDSNYLHNVPSYFGSVFASNVQPSALVAVAWIGALVSSWRGSREGAFLSLCALLFAPFVLAVADRGLALRDLLPVVYLSYVAVGGLVAWLLKYGANLDREHNTRILTKVALAVTVIVVCVVTIPKLDSVTQEMDGVYPDDWQNPLSQEVGAWLTDNLEPGTRVISTRLYYSQLYFLTDGQFPIFQLPTTEVEVMPGAEVPVKRRSSLFRWEDDRLPPDSASDRWLYLTRYPYKGYLVGLAEGDLLSELVIRQADYLVITTPDAGFSSPSFLPYFDSHPAFLRQADFQGGQAGEVRIYSIDRQKLAPHEQRLRITWPALEYLGERTHNEPALAELLRRMNPHGFLVTER